MLVPFSKSQDSSTPMNEQTYYAIRHRVTGRFLPAMQSWGFTRSEPVAPDKAPPRLFITKGAATQALDWWLKGEAYENRQENENWEGDVEVRIVTIPRPSRRRENMEIVAVLLHVETLDEAALRRL